MQINIQAVFKNPNFYIFFIIITCYFFFPSWKLLGIPRSRLLFVSYGYLVMLAISLRLGQEILRNPVLENSTNKTAHSWLETGIFIIILAIMFLAHYTFLDWPILSGDDEAIHIRNQLLQHNKLLSVPVKIVFESGILCLLIIIILTSIATPTKKSIFSKPAFQYFSFIKYAVFLILLFCSIYYFLSVSAKISTGWGGENRWPPVGTILGALSMILMGTNEIAARFPSLIFSLGTGFFVFRISQDECGYTGGLVSIIVLFSSPLFFEYGHLDFREAGGAFFLSAGMYYLIKYMNRGNVSDLGFSIFSLIAGFLERQPTAILFPVIVIFTLYTYFKNNQKKIFTKEGSYYFLAYSSIFLASLSAIYPWMLMSKGVRPYHFYISNLREWHLVMAYITKFPEILSWPLIMMMIGGLYVSIIKRSNSGLVAFITLFFLYIFFTADVKYWIPTDRFLVMFLPAMSILCAHLIIPILNIGIRNITVAVVLMLSTGSLYGWWAGNPRFGLLSPTTKTLSMMPYYPFEDIVVYFKENNITRGKILLPMFWQTPLLVYPLFHQIKRLDIVSSAWVPNRERKTTIGHLSEECARIGCKALILRLTIIDKNMTEVNYLPDLQYSQIADNKLDDFTVKKILFCKNNGLALLLPNAELPQFSIK